MDRERNRRRRAFAADREDSQTRARARHDLLRTWPSLEWRGVLVHKFDDEYATLQLSVEEARRLAQNTNQAIEVKNRLVHVLAVKYFYDNRSDMSCGDHNFMNVATGMNRSIRFKIQSEGSKEGRALRFYVLGRGVYADLEFGSMKMRDKQFNEACKATIEIKENPFEIKKVSLLNADCEEGLNAHIDHFKKVMSDFHKSMARGINGEA